MKKLIFGSSVLICAIIFGAWLHSFFPSDIGVVIIDNRSGQDIASATIQVREIELVCPKIPNGDFYAVRYEVPGDSHYEVEATFESGRTLELESGYMTSGMDAFDVMEIQEDRILHKSTHHQSYSSREKASN
jgi:hypothetical protein